MEQRLAITTPNKPEWHKLTNWRYIDDVKEFYPHLYEEWKRKGIIPHYIIKKLEDNNEFNSNYSDID